jgi:hypothetical protein
MHPNLSKQNSTECIGNGGIYTNQVKLHFKIGQSVDFDLKLLQKV